MKSWMFHRLRAMSAVELLSHVRKKFRQRQDALWVVGNHPMALAPGVRFPRLPDPGEASAEVRDFLRRDAMRILGGEWRAFGHLRLRVDDPPAWQMDYLVRKEFGTDSVAFRLNHRALPGGDVKLIWELSRWIQIVRVAQWAWLARDDKAGGNACNG